MNTLTPFGKLLRLMRLDRSQTLKDMTVQIATKAGYDISSAFLSAVELGRKTVSAELMNAVAKAYELDEKAMRELNRAAEDSAAVFKIRPTPDKRQLVTQFARRFAELDQAEVIKILNVLNQDKIGDKPQ